MKDIRLIPVDYRGEDYTIVGLNWQATKNLNALYLDVTQLLTIGDSQAITALADDLTVAHNGDANDLDTYRENLTTCVMAIRAALETGRITEGQAARYAEDLTRSMDLIGLLLDYVDGVAAGNVELPNVGKELADV